MKLRNKLALGAIVGAAAGIVAGFLTLPRSRRHIQIDLKEKAHELKKHAKRNTSKKKAS